MNSDFDNKSDRSKAATETSLFNLSDCGRIIESCSFTDSEISEIDIPNEVEIVDARVFENCINIERITLPKTLSEIGEFAFSGCVSLAKISIPELVKSIGDGAFAGCESLESIHIPSGVESIGNAAFARCYRLQNITVDEDNKHYKSIDGNLYTKDGKTLIQYALGQDKTNFVISDGVTHIGRCAFLGCPKLENITIPCSVEFIEEMAFAYISNLICISVDEKSKYYKSLDGNLYTKDGAALVQYSIGKTDTSFSIPYSVVKIRTVSFAGCESLINVKLPNGVTHIGHCSFLGCESLASVTIPNSIVSIGYDSFERCPKLRQVYYGGTREEWVNTPGYANLPLGNVCFES